MKYLILDLETTGLDVKKDSITELGYVIYEEGQSTPMHLRSDLVKQTEPLSKEIIELTGITDVMLEEFGRDWAVVAEEFLDRVHQHKIQVLIGHNALKFDKPFLANSLERINLKLPGLPWIDTKIDLPLGYKPKSTSLLYMAADHGFLNPFAHRAVFDSLTCGKLISNYSMTEIMAVAASPMVEIRAAVSYENRSKAGKRGFRWDGERKMWLKEIRLGMLEKEKAQADFHIVELGQVE